MNLLHRQTKIPALLVRASELGCLPILRKFVTKDTVDLDDGPPVRRLDLSISHSHALGTRVLMDQ